MIRELYPDNWEEISFKKKESADWKCEECGKQCRRPGEPFDTHKGEEINDNRKIGRRSK